MGGMLGRLLSYTTAYSTCPTVMPSNRASPVYNSHTAQPNPTGPSPAPASPLPSFCHAAVSHMHHVVPTVCALSIGRRGGGSRQTGCGMQSAGLSSKGADAALMLR